MNERASRFRKQLLAHYGLTEETLDSVSEDVQAELGSKLMYETTHSPEAKFEQGLYRAAEMREKRLLVKNKAEAIIAVQRKRALDFSIPKKLVAAVRQRSTHLYYSELRDHFRQKYIAEIEKSDLLIPVVKAAALKAEEPNMPNLYEVGSEMSAELLHPDAFGQILAERHAVKQASREQRKQKIRNFFYSDLPHAIHLTTKLFILIAPYLILLAVSIAIVGFFKTPLKHFDRITYHVVSDLVGILATAIAILGMIASSLKLDTTEQQKRAYKRIAKLAFAVALVMAAISLGMYSP